MILGLVSVDLIRWLLTVASLQGSRSYQTTLNARRMMVLGHSSSQHAPYAGHLADRLTSIAPWSGCVVR
jgi:hypothetical protein